MPVYSWKCSECAEITEVVRPSADIDKGPNVCQCGSNQFSNRVILPHRNPTVKGFILMEGGAGGFHQFEYTRTRSIK